MDPRTRRVSVGLLQLEFRLRLARSLKDKRSAVSRLQRLRSNHNVSVAEVDAQDDLRRLVVAIGMVGNDRRRLESQLDQIADKVDGMHIAELVSRQVTVETL